MKIERTEMMLIVEGACKMAFQDGKFLPEEKNFLDKVGNLARIAPEVMEQNYDQDMLMDLDQIIDEIQSDEGRKLLLLTIAAVAAIDKEIHESELQLINQVSAKLKLPNLHLTDFNHIELAKKAMLLIKKHA
ncbi:MAG: hypothetical protein QNL04_00145 [SAR324 cluster bacterium]|nr:hypothetical protein [SAR324 cluster bacterium]